MVYAIIVAAGKGIRMNRPVPKQYLDLEGVPLLSRTLRTFDGCESIEKIILVVPSCDIGFCADKVISQSGIRKQVVSVAGGSERQDSVYNGLLAVEEEESTIVIHDGVRPFVTPDKIEECIKQSVLHGACILGMPASDTLKLVNGSGCIEKTMKREAVWLAQTPQAFKYTLIKRAHDCARRDDFKGTDDASLVERLGGKVMVIKGSINNIKITTPEDLAIARAIIGAGGL